MPKVNRILADDQKHEEATKADEELQDEKGALGHAPEGVEDIDQTLKSVGLPSDEKGPRELNSQKVLDEADKHQQ